MARISVRQGVGWGAVIEVIAMKGLDSGVALLLPPLFVVVTKAGTYIMHKGLTSFSKILSKIQ
jgi:hypothetical protein